MINAIVSRDPTLVKEFYILGQLHQFRRKQYTDWSPWEEVLESGRVTS